MHEKKRFSGKLNGFLYKHRVLVPGGKLSLVWNSRDHTTTWVKELDTEVLLPLYKQSNTPNVKFGEWEKVLSGIKKALF